MRVDTVYKRYGDVFAYSCVAVTLAALALFGMRLEWGAASRRPDPAPTSTQ